MHPFSIIAAAAVALLLYSNFVFYYRPPVPGDAALPTYAACEFEQRRAQNVPFFSVGLPPVPSHALAYRADVLEAGCRQVVMPEPRSRRVLYLALEPPTSGKSPQAGGVPVVLALGHRTKIRAMLPAGYSLFVPPSWRAQMVVPEGMVCTLHSSDSAGSLCLRLPKLLGPVSKLVGGAVRSFLSDATATLDRPPRQRPTRQPRNSAPSRSQGTPASCTPSAPPSPPADRSPQASPRKPADPPRASIVSCPSSQASLTETDRSTAAKATISL